MSWAMPFHNLRLLDMLGSVSGCRHYMVSFKKYHVSDTRIIKLENRQSNVQLWTRTRMRLRHGYR